MSRSPAASGRGSRTLAALLAVVLGFSLLLTGVAGAQYPGPVDGVVVDTFRPPAHIGAPGNRGWEYSTAPGSEVRSIAPGVVVFAGPIGGRLYVSVDHGGGLRTAYSYVAVVLVAAGDSVGTGHVIATTGARFHFGARRHGVYIDPATLFGGGPAGRPRLIPRPGRVR